jgi:hypothetical protein
LKYSATLAEQEKEPPPQPLVELLPPLAQQTPASLIALFLEPTGVDFYNLNGFNIHG